MLFILCNYYLSKLFVYINTVYGNLFRIRWVYCNIYFKFLRKHLQHALYIYRH